MSCFLQTLPCLSYIDKPCNWDLVSYTQISTTSDVPHFFLSGQDLVFHTQGPLDLEHLSVLSSLTNKG